MVVPFLDHHTPPDDGRATSGSDVAALVSRPAAVPLFAAWHDVMAADLRRPGAIRTPFSSGKETANPRSPPNPPNDAPALPRETDIRQAHNGPRTTGNRVDPEGPLA
ncbi:hypothetical protein Skr01_28570 [Sphaerisporangium krabiense]|nr:hypothetical protein Skr01_28570 [Sphaerisporangium krabiense]